MIKERTLKCASFFSFFLSIFNVHLFIMSVDVGYMKWNLIVTNGVSRSENLHRSFFHIWKNVYIIKTKMMNVSHGPKVSINDWLSFTSTSSIEVQYMKQLEFKAKVSKNGETNLFWKKNGMSLRKSRTDFF